MTVWDIIVFGMLLGVGAMVGIGVLISIAVVIKTLTDCVIRKRKGLRKL